MEQHLAGSDADHHGLERGDSRYLVWRCNWCALGGMDRFVRPHTTKSFLDYAQNRLPGEMISLDTGDSNVYSVFLWGSSHRVWGSRVPHKGQLAAPQALH